MNIVFFSFASLCLEGLTSKRTFLKVVLAIVNDLDGGVLKCNPSFHWILVFIFS